MVYWTGAETFSWCELIKTYSYSLSSWNCSPSPSTEIIFTGHFHHNSWIYSWLVTSNCLVIRKIIRSISDYIIIEHWSQTLDANPNVSPSAASLSIRKCDGCHLNNTAMIDPRLLPKKNIPNCLISIEKRVVLKLLVVKKINDTASVSFSNFILEQTARHRCFSNSLVATTSITNLPVIPFSSNH